MAFQVRKVGQIVPVDDTYAVVTLPVDPDYIIELVRDGTWVCRENMLVFVTDDKFVEDVHTFTEFVVEHFSEEQRARLAKVISDKIQYLEWMSKKIIEGYESMCDC